MIVYQNINHLILSSVCFLMFAIGYGQEKYIDKNGTIVFEASEKLFEEVKATNTSTTAIYNITTNEIAALALIKGFRFKNSLMEEHFNENYIESGTYPKAIFRGKLIDFNTQENLGSTTAQVKVKGVLELHGKQKEIETMLTIQKVNDIISLTGAFSVTPADFGIEIPKIVRNKIAKVVNVNLDFKLIKK
ncbi:YceI family protein [Hyunsoonleella ulvae]|uniref:YceI family protein n=1 Tax=Hyunsoonleella ulvae TaxID=2799948 RepID=UPI001EEFFE7C|nr:YceI family protein [Hyunsoonleella ulvae]